jgi:hypothetical protein
MNCEASLSRFESEPQLAEHPALRPQVARALLAAASSLLLPLLTLHTRLGTDSEVRPIPELGPFSDAIDGALRREIADLAPDEARRSIDRRAEPGGGGPAGNELREAYSDLCHALASGTPQGESADRLTTLLSETDFLVDAVDTIGHLLASRSTSGIAG